VFLWCGTLVPPLDFLPIPDVTLNLQQLLYISVIKPELFLKKDSKHHYNFFDRLYSRIIDTPAGRQAAL